MGINNFINSANSTNFINFIKQNKYILIIIFVICIIFYYFVWNTSVSPETKAYENFIYGYWTGDEGFCEESDVSSMMLFIGKSDIGEDKLSSQKITRKAYLVINNDVTNQTLDICYTPQCAKKIGKYKVDAKLKFEEECSIPENVTLEFDMIKGLLKIYADDTIYGVFYKNNEVTNCLQ